MVIPELALVLLVWLCGPFQSTIRHHLKPQLSDFWPSGSAMDWTSPIVSAWETCARPTCLFALAILVSVYEQVAYYVSELGCTVMWTLTGCQSRSRWFPQWRLAEIQQQDKERHIEWLKTLTPYDVRVEQRRQATERWEAELRRRERALAPRVVVSPFTSRIIPQLPSTRTLLPRSD
ncbi:hypothetical protein F4808DRAFT_292631 [Astrocystis sublimbata]|nr:hypothetical protein F4808DRAFT_292631 [Astrocystis sublimbata]